MAYLQVLPEVAGYVSVYKKGTKESTWAHEINTYYGHVVTAGFQRGAKDKFDYYGRCKRAAILWNWIDGQPIETIEKKFSVTPYAGKVGASDIRGCADRTRLYLQSAHDLVSILLLGEGPDEIAINTLLQQLEFGLPANALDLIKLPVSLSRGEYLALYQAGYVTSKEVLQSLEKLPPLLGELRIKQLMGEI